MLLVFLSLSILLEDTSTAGVDEGDQEGTTETTVGEESSDEPEPGPVDPGVPTSEGEEPPVDPSLEPTPEPVEINVSEISPSMRVAKADKLIKVPKGDIVVGIKVLSSK